MKILVDIADENAQFGIKDLNSLSFVKKVSMLPSSSLALFKDLNEAAMDVRSHKQGKLKLKTAKQLLDEL